MRLSRRHFLTAVALIPASPLLASPNALAASAVTHVGAVDDILNYAWGTPPGLTREELEHQDAIFMNEVIETDAESALEILFADGSRLTVGENSAVIIDEFVFDPSAVDGLTTLDLAKGVFRYISGSMPKENITINTPTITTGIRGTELKFTVRDDGETEMSTIAGEALCRSRVTGRELLIRARESAVMASDGRWRGGVRNFVHRAGSIVIDDGLAEARRRWRVRKVKRVRERPRDEPGQGPKLPTEPGGGAPRRRLRRR